MNYLATGMYRKAIKQMLSVSKMYGGKTGHMQQVEFFFYSEMEDKASNLAIELSGMGYSVSGIDKSGENWSIIGATPMMTVDEDTLTKWEKLCMHLLRKQTPYSTAGVC